MKQAIFAGGEQIGSLKMEQDGLFWKFSCRLDKKMKQIQRIYVVKSWQVEYLGIPDADGALTAKLPRSRLPEGIDLALATELPRGEWLPWSGNVEGISVTEAFIQPNENGIKLALTPQETLKFPAWAEKMTAERVYDTTAAGLQLSADGHLPMTEREFGGTENEILEETDGDFIDPVLLDDRFAGDDFGDGIGIDGGTFEGWEADRPDI